jgi:hypothetical protein
VSGQALPGRDAARPAMRVAFAFAWLVGALLVAAVVAGVAGAASPTDDTAAAAHAGEARDPSAGSLPLVSAP